MVVFVYNLTMNKQINNKKKEIVMDYVTKVKKLRIKILNKMKNTKVKPPKHFFPHINMMEYNQIPAVNGFHVIWTKNKMSYNFASITVDGVINQVLKLEGVK
jgi:polyribonucleotide nucleotidyltransferase